MDGIEHGPRSRFVPGYVVRSFIVALVAGAALLAGCGTPRPTRSQPPPRLEAPSRVCADRTTSFFGGTPLEDRESWYGHELRSVGERALCRPPGDSTPLYRFLWVPSGHRAVVVRIESGPNGFRLASKDLASRVTYDLNDADIQLFSRLVAEARFWELPTLPPPDGTMERDGARWMLEGLEDGRYHVVDRWSPRRDGPDAAYRRLGEWLLARSALVPASLVTEY